MHTGKGGRRETGDKKSGMQTGKEQSSDKVGRGG
jgi:hypothetical protein